MADEAFNAPSENPLDQIFDQAQNDNAPIAAAPGAADGGNPLDSFGPALGEGTSATGSFMRSMARGVLPSVAAFPAMGAGAQAGAAAGAFGGPIGATIGGVTGAIIAGFGASYAASEAQDWAIKKLPDTWQEAIGQDERQRKLDEQQHGTAAFLGGLVPTVLTMKPGLPGKVPLRENATALERIMSYPATAAVFGGGVMGGMELGSQLAGDAPVNWTHVAVATGVGVVFNKPTAFGERLIEMGAKPARARLGQPEPSPLAPEVPGTPEAAPADAAEGTLAPVAPGFVRFYHGGDETGSGGSRWVTPDPEYARRFRAGETDNAVHYVDIPEGDPAAVSMRAWDELDEGTNAVGRYRHGEIPEEWAKQLRPIKEPAREVTAKDWNETLLGQRPPPTVLEAGDAKVIGPGITESVFMGTQEQTPQAAMSVQQAVRNERLALGESPLAPDPNQTARQMEPELFARYEDLQAQQADFRRWIAEAEADGGAPNAAAALKTIEAEIDTLSPQIAAAYRRAADAGGLEALEPVSREAPALVPEARPVEEQRNFIARDVEEKLIAAGRPPEEAQAAARMTAARYQTRAGRLGLDAQDLYLREAPEIAGPDGKVIKTDTPERARADLTRIINAKAPPAEIAAHPVVKEATAYNDSRPKTSALPGYGTPEFQANREFNFPDGKVKGYEAATERLVEQARAYSPDGPVKKNHEAILVLGPPAAGKSHFAEKLAKKNRSAIPDPDDAKKVIPEYEGGRAANAVHDESSDISAEVLKRLVRDGENLVIPRVGHDLEKMRAYIKALQDQGYTVSVVNMTVDPAEAYRRMIRRFLKTGRVIGSEYFSGVGTKPRENYYTLKNEGLFDEGIDIDANRAPGQERILDAPDSRLAADLGFGQRDGGPGLEGAAEPAEAGAKAPVEDTGAEPPKGPMLVYRIGSEAGGLENRNAGNVRAVAEHMVRQADAEGPVSASGVGNTITVYSVELPEQVGPYQAINAQQAMTGIATVGRRATKHGDGVYATAYSFPAGFQGEVVARVPANAVAAELKAMGYANADEAGTLATERAIRAAVERQKSPDTVAADPVDAAYEAREKIDTLTPAEQRKELPRFTPERDSILPHPGPDKPAGVFMFDPTTVNVDAKRFQFKSGGDEFGVTGALRGVQKWDPGKAQAIMVWEDNTGKLFVADGHQRAGLARRLTSEGKAKDIQLPGILYREVDGISAEDMRALAAVTNIANGSGSALDGAKVLRVRPDLMDESLPLSTGKGQQAAALARLGDEAFRMVVNEVVPEHFGAVVGELLPTDHARQAAALKAIAKFEPRNVEEATVLTQRVAAAELAKKEEGAQASMFGDMETAESTAGEEMKIVGRVIRDLKKDSRLFSRVVANAERIEETGSQIARDAAKTVMTDAEVFAKTLASDAYAAGPVRTELVAAARDLKNGKATLGEATDRIHAAVRQQVEAHGADRAGARGRDAEPAQKEFAQATDQEIAIQREKVADLEAAYLKAQGEASTEQQRFGHGARPDFERLRAAGEREAQARNAWMDAKRDLEQPQFEPGAEGKPQQLIPGVEPIQPKSQRDLIQERANAPLRGGQQPMDEGLFGERRQGELFQQKEGGYPLAPRSEWHGEANFEQTGGRMVTMSPDEFLAKAKPLTMDPESRENIDILKKHIQDGKTLDPLQLYKDGKEDGRHRAIAAKELGITEVPVIDLRGTEARDFEQTARGKVRISEGRKPIITLMKDANASTFIHESGHVYLEELARDAFHPNAPVQLRDDLDTTLQWLGVKSVEDIKTKQHEKWARGWEQYLREGVAPSKELAGVFARFKDWLLQIYDTLRGLGAPINDEIRGVFDRMLAMEPQRTVLAPEREATGPTIHDIHETEAREVSTPEEALPKADQVAAEANRYAAELPPEVKHELETKIAELEREIAELKGPEAGGKPAGEAGPGAAEGGEVEAGSGKPGALTAGGEGSEESGAVGERGTGAAAESVAIPDVDTGNPLAPKPATLFGPEQSPFIDKAGNIRLDTLTNVEEARQAIRDAAAANQDFIGDRRGVVTDGQVMDLARAAGMEGAEKIVKNRVIGQAFSAEEVMTLRLALDRASNETSVAAKKAANGSDADVLAYAAAKERQTLIQAVVAQAAAEWGRAGRAFRNITKITSPGVSPDLVARQETGKTLFQLRQEAQLAAQLDNPAAVAKFVADSRKRGFGYMLLEYWINGLLSGPATHSTQIVGTAILSLQHHVPETAAAALIGQIRKALGREGEIVRFGEIGARFKGAQQGLPTALKATGESFAAGTNVLLPGEQPKSQVFQVGHENAPRPTIDQAATFHSVIGDAFAAVQGIQDAFIATGALIKAGGEAGAPLIGAKPSLTGAIPDIQVKGVTVLPIGTAARLPGRFLTTSDSFFRALNYSMELNARAYRMASEEGLTGTRFDARVAEIRSNPPEAMMREIVESAQQLSVMESGGKFLGALTHLSNVEIGGLPALKFVMPFVRVAGNILRQTVVERTALGLLSPEIRADLMGKNGTVAADTAAARILVGTTMAILMGGLAAQGYASGSGPTDRNEAAMWRLAGNQAHSVRIGDMWYGVERLGPTGMLMSIAADMYEVSKAASDGDLEDAAAKLMHAFTQNILDQSMMKGPSDLLRAVNDSDRYGSQYVRNFLSSFVPYSIGMQQLAKQSDPYSNQARSVVDAIRAKIPGHLDSLFENPLYPKRDIWGEPMTGMQRFGLTSIATKQLSTDPVNLALLELGVSPASVQRKIRGVELTDTQFDDYARMAGRMTKQRLDVIVNSPDWRTWPNYARALIIEETVKQSREVARGMMMAKYRQIAKDATEARQEKFRD